MLKNDKNVNILIIEDEPDYNNLIKLILEKGNYNIFQAYSADDAIDIILNNNFHIMIIDICLPSMSGLDLIDKIKNINNSAEIIATSGNYNFYNEQLKGKIHSFIKKPFKFNELLNICENISNKIELNKKY